MADVKKDPYAGLVGVGLERKPQDPWRPKPLLPNETSFWDPATITSAFDQSFTGAAGNAFRKAITETPEWQDEPDWDPTKDKRFYDYADQWHKLIDTGSRAEFEHEIGQLAKSRQSKETLSKAGLPGFFWSFVADTPLAAGYTPNVLRGVGRVATLGKLSKAPYKESGTGILAVAGGEEFVRQIGDPARTSDETAMSVAVSTIAHAAFMPLFVNKGTAGEFTEAMEKYATFEAANAKRKAAQAAGYVTADPIADAQEAMLKGAADLSRNPRTRRLMDDYADAEVDAARQGSVGAMLAPKYEVKFKSAGGLEKAPLNPLFRIVAGQSDEAKLVALNLVDSPGMSFTMNTRGVATPVSAERWARIRYNYQLKTTLDSINDAFLRYRGVRQAGDEGTAKLADGLRVDIGDATRIIKPVEAGNMKRHEFRQEIGKALIDGGRHEIPEVAEAAAAVRKQLNEIKDRAADVDMFVYIEKRGVRDLKKRTEAETKNLKTVEKRIKDLEESALKDKNKKNIAELRRAAIQIRRTIADMDENIKALEAKILRKRTEALQSPKGDEGYFPRHFRYDKIRDNPEAFKNAVRTALINEGQAEGIEKMVESIYRNMLNRKDYDDIFRFGGPMSSHDRVLDLPSRYFYDFMELDVDRVLRYHSKTMGTAIEIMRKFPDDLDLQDTLEELTRSMKEKVGAGKMTQKDADATIRDVKALHEKVIGIYGQPDDPYRMISRAGRTIKNLNYMTMLGMSTVSAFVDPARLAMTEGIIKGFGKPAMQMLDDMSVVKLGFKEGQKASEALDMWLGLRVNALFDVGDVGGRMGRIEEFSHRSSAVFSIANLLTPWTDGMKSVSSLVIQDRILHTAKKVARGTATVREKEKLASAGISMEIAEKIAAQEKHWVKGKHITVANTDHWEDLAAMEGFWAALSYDVRRTIITPGAADKPNWMSTELGTIIGQFKGFAVASLHRTLIGGLQDRDAAAAYGVAMMVGFGMMSDQIRDLWKDNPKSPDLKTAIMNGIDRSGVLGWLMDVNNTVESLTDNSVGLRPLVGIDGYKHPANRKIGQVFGPTAQQAARVTSVTGDVLSGNIDGRTSRNFGALIPTQNLWSVMWAHDQIWKNGY